MACSPLIDHSDPPPPPRPQARPPAPPRWVAHAIAECALQADFPGSPTLSSQPTKTPEGSVTTYSAELVRPESWSLSLACTKLASKLHPGKWARVLDGGRDGLLRSSRATLVSEQPIIGGRELVFNISGEECRARILIVEDKIITAIVMPVSGFGAEKTKRFFHSIDVQID